MLNRFTQNRLRKAYDEPLSRAFLARRFSVSERTIARFWRDELDAGRLIGPRKHFADTTAPAPRGEAPPAADYFDAVDDAASDIELDRQIADLERAAESFTARHERDSSNIVAALKRAHPELDNFTSHTAPAPWLTRDLDITLAPAPEKLRAMARKFDQKGYSA